jgi:hypothetical protein
VRTGLERTKEKISPLLFAFNALRTFISILFVPEICGSAMVAQISALFHFQDYACEHAKVYCNLRHTENSEAFTFFRTEYGFW